MNIKVKSHKRTRKNGVSVVRNHSKKSNSTVNIKARKLLSSKGLDLTNTKSNPKTGKMRMAIASVSKNPYSVSHKATGTTRFKKGTKYKSKK